MQYKSVEILKGYMVREWLRIPVVEWSKWASLEIGSTCRGA